MKLETHEKGFLSSSLYYGFVGTRGFASGIFVDFRSFGRFSWTTIKHSFYGLQLSAV